MALMSFARNAFASSSTPSNDRFNHGFLHLIAHSDD